MGIALLEAIVALALLSGAGLALFAWINQNLETASRLGDRLRTLQMQANAQALVESVNPAVQPQGEMSTAGMRVRWKATLVEPMRSNAAFAHGQPGEWRLGLYRLDVEVSSPSGADALRFSQLQAGWVSRSRPDERGL